jgi:hypothetical protein
MKNSSRLRISPRLMLRRIFNSFIKSKKNLQRERPSGMRKKRLLESQVSSNKNSLIKWPNILRFISRRKRSKRKASLRFKKILGLSPLIKFPKDLRNKFSLILLIWFPNLVFLIIQNKKLI